jgi:hypothetical protein
LLGALTDLFELVTLVGNPLTLRFKLRAARGTSAPARLRAIHAALVS